MWWRMNNNGAHATRAPPPRHHAMTGLGPHLGVLSLEPWDGVWRRNQHLATQLLEQGLVERITFVEPAGRTPIEVRAPHPGVSAVRPRLRVARRAGGLALVAAELLHGPLRGVDRLWVNDAPLGRWTVRRRIPVFHDVTDDWRETVNTARVRNRLVRAADWLATHAQTIVCSPTLAQRWEQRCGVTASVVPNGVDLASFAGAAPVELSGRGPHVGYVGTLHAERLDVPLVVEVARTPGIGTMHPVGPGALDAEFRAQLDAAGVLRHGPVPHTEVAGWMEAMDVLVCSHLVTPFTLSLDAIKAREYLAAGRQAGATPTPGFQELSAVGAHVVDRAGLATEVVGARVLTAPPPASPPGWVERAAAMGRALAGPSPHPGGGQVVRSAWCAGDTRACSRAADT